MTHRKIIHVDMDAFFASVEQQDQPALRGKPLAVGGSEERRGVIAAASYEARRYGVRSAMATRQARALCPDLVVVPPRFERYQELSERIHSVFKQFTDQVEPLALDEAYLDVSGAPSARDVAREIKRLIFDATKLTASAGVGPNKFLAKLASEHKKPNGLFVIRPEQALLFVSSLPVEKLWGVGPATAKRLHQLGIVTAKDLQQTPVSLLEQKLGKFGLFLYELSYGRDDRAVETEQEPKSRGSETTFERDIRTRDALRAHLAPLAHEIAQSLFRNELETHALTVKLKSNEFQLSTRSRTYAGSTDDPTLIAERALELLDSHPWMDFLEGRVEGPHGFGIRLLGLSASRLVHRLEPRQLGFLFERERRDEFALGRDDH